MPAVLLCLLVTFVGGIIGRVLSTVAIILILVDLGFVLVSSIAFVIIAYRWLIRNKVEGVPDVLPETKRQYENIRYRSNVILAEIVTIGLTLGIILFQFIVGTDLPLRYFGTHY